MLKKLASLCIASAMVLSAAGCGVVGSRSDTNSSIESVATNQTEKERVIAEAQAYLKESYPDDVFTYYTGKSPDWAYHYYELTFTSQKYDNQYVTVYGTPRKDADPNSVVTSYYKDDNGNVIYDYYDTYFEYSMKDEAEKYFYDIIKDYITDEFVIKIAFQSSVGFAKKVDTSKKFIDNYTNDDLDFFVYFLTENDTRNAEDAMVNVIDKFKKDNRELWLDYVVVNDLSEVVNCDISDIMENYDYYFKKRVSYSTTYENN